MPIIFEQVIIMGLLFILVILAFIFRFGFKKSFTLFVLELVLIGTYEGYLIDSFFIIFDLPITIILVRLPGILWRLDILLIDLIWA